MGFHQCSDCNEYFSTPDKLAQHMHSHVRLGYTIACRSCDHGHNTMSKLVHHRETGSCEGAPRCNRKTILHNICIKDNGGVITNQAYDRWRSEYCCSYEMCDDRRFDTVDDVMKHLVDKHGEAYCSPNSECKKSMVSLAAVTAHLESGTCDGMDYEEVQLAMEHWLYS
jgi:hypothetical protein